jgi:hypothetical protein
MSGPTTRQTAAKLKKPSPNIAVRLESTRLPAPTKKTIAATIGKNIALLTL